MRIQDKQVVLTGHPKFDYSQCNKNISGKVWPRGLLNEVKRILWTPRWRTLEGNCHFFDYKDYFVDYCKKHQDVDFVFRPHPLCLGNFLKTGELSEDDLQRIKLEYGNSSNMSLDETGDYIDTFIASDVLVSDISSMLLEYFVTGKPIIYTHRVDTFNELGRKLSEGFYWVENSTELQETLDMLMGGNDPLKFKREELIREHLYMPEGGAGVMIKDTLLADYVSTAIDII
jgi:CDP-glycerol glycerophosphotransferase (TagB/SpsB family)